MAEFTVLDLGCSAGGASEGYARAGAAVVGVDIRPQPRYRHDFVLVDMLEVDLRGYDLIHCSPPCQAYSAARHISNKEHPRLIEPMRDRLREAGVPYVIENVVGAPLIDPITLCGSTFGLSLRRHRLFEAPWMPFALHPACQCPRGSVRSGQFAGVYGGGSRTGNFGCRWGSVPDGFSIREWWAQSMGIDWMTRRELTQAIPPAYTEFIGRAFLRELARCSQGPLRGCSEAPQTWSA